MVNFDDLETAPENLRASSTDRRERGSLGVWRGAALGLTGLKVITRP